MKRLVHASNRLKRFLMKLNRRTVAKQRWWWWISNWFLLAFSLFALALHPWVVLGGRKRWQKPTQTSLLCHYQKGVWSHIVALRKAPTKTLHRASQTLQFHITIAKYMVHWVTVTKINSKAIILSLSEGKENLGISARTFTWAKVCTEVTHHWITCKDSWHIKTQIMKKSHFESICDFLVKMQPSE